MMPNLDEDPVQTSGQAAIPTVAKTRPQPYRVTCNSCNKNLSSVSVPAHAKRMHGLRGSVETLATRVEQTPDLPLPQPAQDVVVGIPEENAQVFFTSEPEAQDPEEV